MPTEAEFDQKFGEDFQLNEKYINYCSPAGQFAIWAEELIDSLGDADIVGINQAKLHLLDKYFDWLQSVPKKHRHRLSSTGHTCIYSVFTTTYDKLRKTELSLAPPPLHLAEAVGSQIAGIFLGEKE